MTEEIAFSDWSEKVDKSNSGDDSIAGCSNNDNVAVGEQKDIVIGANSWLPAYGFHHPASLQQTYLQEKQLEFYANDDVMDNGCNGHLILETIIEETSDDLRSDTSSSDYNSGLHGDSLNTVIHMPDGKRFSSWTDITTFNRFIGKGRLGSGGELNTDPGVQDDDEEFDDFDDDSDDESDNDEDSIELSADEEEAGASSAGKYPSRSSSLLQFEKLERHYENVFRNERTCSDPFGIECSSGSIDKPRWRLACFSSEPDSLNEKKNIFPGNIDNSEEEDDDDDDDDDDDESSSLSSSSCSASSFEVVSSDEDLLNCSASNKQQQHSLPLSAGSDGPVKVCRSLDSLLSMDKKRKRNRCDSVLHNELSQSLCCYEFAKFVEEQCSDAERNETNAGSTPRVVGDIYRTLDCLMDISPSPAEDHDLAEAVVTAGSGIAAESPCHQRSSTTDGDLKTTGGADDGSRSAENLSEDSGFGDHRSSSGNLAKRVGRDAASANDNTAAQVLHGEFEEEAAKGDLTTEQSVNRIVYKQTERQDDREEAMLNDEPSKFSFHSWLGVGDQILPCDHHRMSVVSRVGMTSRISVVSTPNLYSPAEDEDYGPRRSRAINDRDAVDGDGSSAATDSICRSYSLKKINFSSESHLSAASSKGSSVQITTSFVNLTNVNSGSSKGVHFCPVVSEVSWRDSFTSEDADDDDEEIPGEPYYEDLDNEEAPTERSRPPVGTIVERDENEREPRDDESPSIDELVDKLLSESVTGRSSSDKNRWPRSGNECHRGGLTTDAVISSSPTTPVCRDALIRGGGASLAGSGGGAMTTGRSVVADDHPRSVHSSLAANDSVSSIVAGSMNENASPLKSPEKQKSVSGKFGGFFQRFSLRRLSGRKTSKVKKVPESAVPTTVAPPVVVGCLPKYQSDANVAGPPPAAVPPPPPSYDTNLKSSGGASFARMQAKPPLPPPRSSQESTNAVFIPLSPSSPTSSSPTPVHEADKENYFTRNSATAKVHSFGHHDGFSMSKAVADSGKISTIPIMSSSYLLETDIDSNVTSSSTTNVHRAGVTGLPTGGAGSSKKSRSLLNLDNSARCLSVSPQTIKQLNSSAPSSSSAEAGCSPGTQQAGGDYRAKSMEFLLDKTNQAAIKPPENELQKVGERKMSEHELRVQRSLQKLNVPEWYKNSAVPPQGFLLKRHSDVGQNTPQQGNHRWTNTSNTLPPCKTTSLSNLGSTFSPAPKSPSGAGGTLTAVSPTHYTFSRWSTSRLNSPSNSNSTNTSPSGSARSSFNYRQPYLGWRSQEKLSKPRTPAERLAAGLLPHQNQGYNQHLSPSLTEVRSSIKEVTSAIVHYVSNREGSSDRLSPSPRYFTDSSSRSTSPRGSTGRLCWVESSFVGSKPIEVPETPSATNIDKPSHPNEKKLFQQQPNSVNTTISDLDKSSSSQQCCSENATGIYPNQINGTNETTNNRFGRKDKLLEPRRVSDSDIENRRVSFGSTSGDGAKSGDSIETASESASSVTNVERSAKVVLVQCQYPKCGKTDEFAKAKRTYKVCHNCDFIYCSRECRRAHWEKHRKACLHSRVGELCRTVLSMIKQNEQLLYEASVIARKGFLTEGRGCVKYFFTNPQTAEHFTCGKFNYIDPVFVKWSSLSQNETGSVLFAELLRICKNYNPDTRLVLYVAIYVVSEIPTNGPVEWERQIVARCAKTKLSSKLIVSETKTKPNSADGVGNSENQQPETLILTSLPGSHGGTQKDRQINFTNIQRHLRQRGVSLRKQFPDVYNRLCSYVECSSETFTPITIYPNDVSSGKTFMCIIMPDAEPEKLHILPKDRHNVKTIDITDNGTTDQHEIF